MKILCVWMAAIAGTTAGAHGAWGFKYQFRDTTTGQWSSNAAATVSGGETVKFRVVAYVDANTTINAATGAGDAVAFCRLTAQEQMTNFGSVAGDAVVTSTKGALVWGHASYTSTSVSGGTTYFGTTLVTSFAAQLLTSGALAAYCPTFGGVPQLEWVVREGSIHLGGPAGVRGLTFSNSARSQTLWYRDLPGAASTTGLADVYAASPSGAPVSLRGGTNDYLPATDIAGTVLVTIVDVPAPATLASLGLFAMCGLRRKRVKTGLVGLDKPRRSTATSCCAAALAALAAFQPNSANSAPLDVQQDAQSVASLDGVQVSAPQPSRAAPGCAGDIYPTGGDGIIDQDDFPPFIFAYNLLICGDAPMPAGCPADFDGDGFVDDSDFIIFTNAYNLYYCP